MSIRVKICGINSAEAFDAAVEAGADWLGFVFFERSPRHVTPRQAAYLSARHAGGPARVGLFVAPTDEAITAALRVVRLDFLQLYAPVARVVAIRDKFGLPVWRAVAVATEADLPGDTGGADALLIEPRPAADAARPGGNAQRLDWGLLEGFAPGYDWLLAGGLTPANVAAAIGATRAPAVDVSSGVETAPGVKSAGLITAFIDAARRSPLPG